MGIDKLTSQGEKNARAQLPSAENLDPGWNAIPTGGVCSAGTPYRFYVKPSSSGSGDLLVFFNGGGACWFGQACDLGSEPNIHFYSYTAGGEVHTIMRSGIFYDYEVEGIRFVDWVRDLINGETVTDISCVSEARGCVDAPE